MFARSDRRLLLPLIFLALGAVSAFIVFGKEQTGIVRASAPVTCDTSTLLSYFTASSRSVIIQCAVIFASAYIVYPQIAQFPVFVQRGAAIVTALRSFDVSDKLSASYVICYAVTTALLLFLASLALYRSRNRERGRPVSYLRYVYASLMICGGSVIITAAPQIISELIK
ncbi:MAG: hypothetical protein IKN38_04655 [Clostridia bacterium]|nr:hypothetical protein [Clostridia bacterium]